MEAEMKSKQFVVAAMALLAVFYGGPEAFAYFLSGLENDAELIALQTAGKFTKTFGGNIRWGNNDTNGDWEYSVVDASDNPILPSNPKQVKWTDYSPTHSYSFSFNSASNSAALGLTMSKDSGSIALDISSGSVTHAQINAIIFRAKAADGDVASLLKPIIINFTSGGSLQLESLTGDSDAQSFLLVDDRLAEGFTVTGAATLADGRGSLPMYQFKVGFSTVPVPAAVWLLGTGLVGLAALKKRGRN
jgi:hypothetical protein